MAACGIGCQPTGQVLDALQGVAQDRSGPRLEWTRLPAYGSLDDVEGQAFNVDPSAYAVALYIYIGGWWTKPTFEAPLTRLGDDGGWRIDYTTGGADHQATQLAAFLVPADYAPPRLEGAGRLPPVLDEVAVASVVAQREAPRRWIDFGGQRWWIKASDVPVGPGPNFFADSEEAVWVDEAGRLHLRLYQRDGRWYSAEVVSEQSFGYGTYVFRTASPVGDLDPNVILGLFTWDDDPAFNHREIDIEFSRWGLVDNENAQFVVQPWEDPRRLSRFDVRLQEGIGTHAFTWKAEAVDFASFAGRVALAGGLGAVPEEAGQTAAWRFDGSDVPPAGNEKVRLNLWLLDGQAPTDGAEVEAVIEAFEFIGPVP